MPSGCVALDRLMVPDEIERADKTAVAAPITKVALHPTLAITEELQQQVQNFDSFRGAAGVHDYASRPDNTPAYDLRCGPAATLQLPSIAAVRFLSGTPLARPNTGSYPFKAASSEMLATCTGNASNGCEPGVRKTSGHTERPLSRRNRARIFNRTHQRL
jgi:hypothetical protein